MINKILIEVEEGNALNLSNPKICMSFPEINKSFGMNIQKEYTVQKFKELLNSVNKIIDTETTQ
jgi:hypothetical protein